MKYVNIFLALFVVIICSSATMKSKEKLVYVFGMAASFNDSIVYCTDIQVVDSVELDKSNFLPQRSDYAYQMKNYLANTYQKENYTCMIYFSENKKKLEKEAAKVKGQYKKAPGMVLQTLDASSFTFKKPNY